jgi:hypothetical protein
MFARINNADVVERILWQIVDFMMSLGSECTTETT